MGVGGWVALLAAADDGNLRLDPNGGLVELVGGILTDGPCDFGGPVRIAGKDVEESLAAVRAPLCSRAMMLAAA